jgi:hypothetical protein
MIGVDEKVQFLKNDFTALLKQISSDTLPAWGKLTLQQMIEHFTDSVRIASGKTVHTDIVTPEEHLDKARNFLMSDKPFRENTPNALMPEVPVPVRNKTIKEAYTELEIELDFFFSVFEKNGLQVTRNPFFGDLNYEQNIHLLYKHALHHLRQFGLTVS